MLHKIILSMLYNKLHGTVLVVAVIVSLSVVSLAIGLNLGARNINDSSQPASTTTTSNNISDTNTVPNDVIDIQTADVTWYTPENRIEHTFNYYVRDMIEKTLVRDTREENK